MSDVALFIVGAAVFGIALSGTAASMIGSSQPVLESGSSGEAAEQEAPNR